jgi:hypothetical protein
MWVWDARHRRSTILSNLKVSEVACDGSVDAWVWMRYIRLLDPFSSNLNVSKAAYLYAEARMGGMDAPHARLTHLIQTSRSVRLHVWM